MTITQLKYIVAVEEEKSFAKAADKCFVTQPTLSMQVKKLEEALEIVLFDRSTKPVKPTPIGRQIIEQARISLSEVNRIYSIIKANELEEGGELRLGIIPTVSPYLLPLFAMSFMEKYPQIRLIIKEQTTKEIAFNLYNDNLDIGILATPSHYKDLVEIPLYYEPFVAYVSNNHPLMAREEIEFSDLNLNNMWLLEEGHCFRNQVINICSERVSEDSTQTLRFESGSLETVRRIVEKQYGYTLLPELATTEFSKKQHTFLKQFKTPKPVREISLVTNRRFLHRKIIAQLKTTILENVPKRLQVNRTGSVIGIEKSQELSKN